MQNLKTWPFTSQIKKDLNGKPLKDAAEDKSLSICWKGKKPFKSVVDVKNYFKPLVLSFTNAKNVQLQLSPEAYLIVTVSTSANPTIFFPCDKNSKQRKILWNMHNNHFPFRDMEMCAWEF